MSLSPWLISRLVVGLSSPTFVREGQCFIQGRGTARIPSRIFTNNASILMWGGVRAHCYKLQLLASTFSVILSQDSLSVPGKLHMPKRGMPGPPPPKYFSWSLSDYVCEVCVAYVPIISDEKIDLDSPEWSDVNIVTGCLKLYLRELPDPVIPFKLYKPFIEAASMFWAILFACVCMYLLISMNGWRGLYLWWPLPYINTKLSIISSCQFVWL